MNTGWNFGESLFYYWLLLVFIIWRQNGDRKEQNGTYKEKEKKTLSI